MGLATFGWRAAVKFCDFGLAIFEPDLFGESPKEYTEDYLKGCGSSRLMDYIKADLGVIISPCFKFQLFIARRYAPVVVTVTGEFLQKPRPILEAALREKARVGKKDLSAITTQGVAQRLGRFYEQVAFGKST